GLLGGRLPGRLGLLVRGLSQCGQRRGDGLQGGDGASEQIGHLLLLRGQGGESMHRVGGRVKQDKNASARLAFNTIRATTSPGELCPGSVSWLATPVPERPC